MNTFNQIRHNDEVLSSSKPTPMAPTESLPPLRKFISSSKEEIESILRNLRLIYFPPPPVVKPVPDPKSYEERFSALPSSLPHLGSMKLLPENQRDAAGGDLPDSGYASAEEDGDEDDEKSGSFLPFQDSSESDVDHDLHRIRADTYEREFAIEWITGLIAHSDVWISAEEEREEDSRLLDEAVELLDALHTVGVEGGDDGEDEEDEEDGALMREFVFPFSPTLGSGNPKRQGENEGEVYVRLNDLLSSKDDHTSVGLQSWGSCILFAERICANPEKFLGSSSNVSSSADANGSAWRRSVRILELGAGTGMLSIVCAKILRGWSGGGEVVATDYHADVLRNLEGNVEMNLSDGGGEGKGNVTITVSHLDWGHPSSYDTKFDEGSFDIILAADVIYYPQHAMWIKDVVKRLLAKPLTCACDCEEACLSFAPRIGGCHDTPFCSGLGPGTFWLFVPIRTTGRHEGMVDTLRELFPILKVGVDGLSTMMPTRAHRLELAILDFEELARRDGVGRADEDGYRLFRIGWMCVDKGGIF